MRRPAKVKLLSPRALLRKSALTATAAARRGFPAWIDSSERSVAFSAVHVVPRVRDALVLRAVAKRKSGKAKGASHVDGTR